MKNRINQLEEVNIWWKIGNNDHCVQLHQAWEQDGILHLQLDLCDGERYICPLKCYIY